MTAHLLGALCMFLVTLLFRAMYLIFFQNGSLPKTRNTRHHPARTMIILGSGGHTTEILRIVAKMKSDRYSPRIYVRASTDTISEAKVRNLEELIAMDVAQMARDLLPSKSLFDDIRTNSPPDITLHLTSLFHKLWLHVNEIENTSDMHKWLRTATVILEACLDRTWEALNSGCWKDVSINQRYCYSFCTILKSALLLAQLRNEGAGENTLSAGRNALIEVLLQIDKGILLGAPPLSMPGLLPTVARKLNSAIIEVSGNKSGTDTDLRWLSNNAVPKGLLPGYMPVARHYRPSLEAFHTDIFRTKTPTILEGCMGHWRALDLWRDPGYLFRTAGVRTVPIEIGSRYTEEDWTQRLVTFSEFLRSYVTSNNSSKRGYLAQHGLFDQIPELMDDISIPDYCSFSDTGDEATPPDVNAWLGPGGTISPLHFDPKNNLLCQVFGMKQVVLFHPQQTPNLYPYETRLLSNTARVDPVNPDFEIWPKFKKAAGTTCTLGPGEMLFIPPGWWHHVVALTPSFSVSFWWD